LNPHILTTSLQNFKDSFIEKWPKYKQPHHFRKKGVPEKTDTPFTTAAFPSNLRRKPGMRSAVTAGYPGGKGIQKPLARHSSGVKYMKSITVIVVSVAATALMLLINKGHDARLSTKVRVTPARKKRKN
jgi:hypothetical protein